MRILHISDLHATAGGADAEQEAIVEALLADVRRGDRELRVDIVAVSGDLSFDGSPHSLKHAREMLLDPLAAILDARPIIIAAGNHDVERSRINKWTETGFANALCTREAVTELFASPDDLEAAIARLRSWHAFEAKWYHERLEYEITGYLARVFRIEGGDVGIVTLNSAWRSGTESDKGHLIIGDHQVRAALGALEGFRTKLVVVHHPLGWLTEFDAESTRASLERSGVFVLTGHDHTPDPTQETTTRGAAVYSRAGCLYAGHAYSNSYTLLDVDPATQRVIATVRRWWPVRREFAEATDMSGGGRVVFHGRIRHRSCPRKSCQCLRF